MGDTAVIAFGAALAGALVGGVASAVGSIFVSRVQLRRDIRVRIYDDMLPWLHGADGSGRGVPDRLVELHRAAVLAGKKDVEYADAIHRPLSKAHAIFWDSGPAEHDETTGAVVTPADAMTRRNALEYEARQAITAYSEWLARKLG